MPRPCKCCYLHLEAPLFATDPQKNPLIHNIAICSPVCDTSVACLFTLNEGSLFFCIELSSFLSLHCLTGKLKIRLRITFLLRHINLSVWKFSFFDLPSRSLMSSVPGRITGRAHGRSSRADCFHHFALTLQKNLKDSPLVRVRSKDHGMLGEVWPDRGCSLSCQRHNSAAFNGHVQYFSASSLSDMIIRGLFEQHFAQMGLDRRQWKAVIMAAATQL